MAAKTGSRDDTRKSSKQLLKEETKQRMKLIDIWVIYGTIKVLWQGLMLGDQRL